MLRHRRRASFAPAWAATRAVNGWVLAGTTFLASSVEFVEAATIVLAVGFAQGWRAALLGAACAAAALGAIVAIFGPLDRQCGSAGPGPAGRRAVSHPLRHRVAAQSRVALRRAPNHARRGGHLRPRAGPIAGRPRRPARIRGRVSGGFRRGARGRRDRGHLRSGRRARARVVGRRSGDRIRGRHRSPRSRCTSRLRACRRTR